MTIRVYPGASNPSHDLSLSDGVQTWGLRLNGGPEALREQPLTPSTLRFDSPAGFGAWEPGMAQIEQRDWSGGRGLERFVAEDPAAARRFYDSMNAWTLTPGKLLPAPQWRLARGLRWAIQHLPGSVTWKGLIGETRLIAARFTVGASDFAPPRARVWLWRVGSPGALFLSIYEDDNGEPGAAVPDSSASVSIAEVKDVVSLFYSFDLTDLQTELNAGIDYHVLLGGSPQDNAANHWEIGVDAKRDGGHTSADGADWNSVKFSPYFRLEDEGMRRNFFFFLYAGGYYVVDQRANGSPSHIYLNGDRGLATGWSTTSLEDAGKAWTPQQWAGAWVRIVKGKGAGQARRIESNTVYELIVLAWDNPPDATSEYVIYATDIWKDISPISGDLIDGVVGDVAVVDDFVLLAQGDSLPILRMRFNTALGVPVHEFDDDGTNAADLLHSFHHPEFGPQVWRALVSAGEVSRAAPTAYGSALTFGFGIKLGDKSQPILSLFDMQSSLWALKADSLWSVGDNERAKRANLGLDALPDAHDPRALTLLGGQLLFGWGHRLFSYSSGQLGDIGPGREQGLPAGRQGSVAALQPLGVGRIAAAVDAGEEGESSVLLWESGAWHELLRAPRCGQRIQSLGLQECPGTRPRLWVGLDGDLACVDLPRQSEAPLGDADLDYQHEAVLVAGTVDMGAARLPKFLKEISLLSENLGGGVQVNLDYQLDEEIDGPRWRSGGAFYSSPLDSLPVSAGQLHSIRTRLRLLTNKAKVPPLVNAVVLEGFARTPLKYQWTLRVRLADLQADRGGGLDANPDVFMLWLQQAARQARKIHMRSIWQALDDKNVIVEPPSVVRQFTDPARNTWGGAATVVLRES
ncbi:MAG: hypothetical protein WEA61_03655 [Anaerolineales bacterium]